MAPAIGIDLGTTYSCVGAFVNGQVQIFPNEQGQRTTPSCVSFTDSGILVGEEAKMNLPINPKNTIYDAKRLIGRRYVDKVVQEDMKLWPFRIVNENRIKIKVRHKGMWKTVYPEEISAHILRKMKSIAEEQLASQVNDAVITVPAYFSDAQRQATKDAGIIAGLNVLRVINEPTAAAIAYGLNKLHEKLNVLIYDLGGGTFDVTIFEINDGVFEVKSTAGDTHLGGQDFTNSLVRYCMNEVREKTRFAVDFDDAANAELWKLCDDAKRTLSFSFKTNVVFNHASVCHIIPITRACFDTLNDNLFRSTLISVEKALSDASMTKNMIDDIVMVGGSSRIPKIQALLETYFDGKKPNFTLNPDECVAYGAAVQAAISSGDDSPNLENVVLMDVNPYSLGIRTIGEIMTVFIPRNTTIPHKTTMTFPTTEADQTGFTITVYEGERPLVKDNNKLDEFIFSGLPPGQKGSIWMDLTFELSVDGILQVSASEQSTGVKKSIVIKNNTDRLSSADLDRLINEAEQSRLDDKKQMKIIAAKNKLDEFCFQIKSDFKYDEIIATEESKKLILNKCDEILNWSNEYTGRDYKVYKRKYTELEDYFHATYQPLQ